MIHEDILSRMALAVGVDPTALSEPWAPRSLSFPAPVPPEPDSETEGGQ